ncbi:hypothetical protein JOM56_008944 [Amanita muscaria]
MLLNLNQTFLMAEPRCSISRRYVPTRVDDVGQRANHTRQLYTYYSHNIHLRPITSETPGTMEYYQRGAVLLNYRQAEVLCPGLDDLQQLQERTILRLRYLLPTWLAWLKVYEPDRDEDEQDELAGSKLAAHSKVHQNFNESLQLDITPTL